MRKPKIGRPRGHKNPGYDSDKLVTISARITVAERELCAARAVGLGLKVSEYVRALVRWDLNLWPHDQSSPPSPSPQSPPT
jgi:hypothetical protein